ncbi:MAG: class D sortase [Xanthomonadaceae bacterium]|nr:class D sortase [Xanthomonadaceae bacterium]
MRTVETILWVAGAALLAFYFGARAHGDYEARQGLAVFEQVRAEMPARETESPTGNLDDYALDQAEWADYRVHLYERDRAAARDAPVAVLRVPDAGLAIPIYGALTERNLNRGAAWIEGTAAPGASGNAGIAGHRDSFFRGLRHVSVGDTIELANHGGTASYRVTDLSVVEPDDVSVLAPADGKVLTLVTCYPFYFAGHAPQRYIVRAEAI